MRIKRKLIAAMMTGLAVMLSAALLGGTLTVATSAAKSASTAKAKHKKPKKHHKKATKKHHKKATCPKGDATKKTKKGKPPVCVKTNIVQTEEKVKEVKEEEVKNNVTVTVTKTKVGKGEQERAQIASEEAALVHPGLWPSESKEKGGTAAVESESAIPAAPKFSNEELEAWAGGNWLSQGGGNTNDHYSDLTEISASNVSGLKSDWVTQLDGSGEQPGIESGSLSVTTGFGNEGAPVEYNGVLYYDTGNADVFAVSVKSGKILWVHKGEQNSAENPRECCYRTTHGIALGNGFVYVGTPNSGIEALEMKTGAMRWYQEVGYENAGDYTVSAAPLYYEGMVYIGPDGSDYGSSGSPPSGSRGYLEAINAETGQIKWKQYNVPGPGEYGHNTWPETSNANCGNGNPCAFTWGTGGASVWNAPTVDPETGDIIYGTTNATSSQYGSLYNGNERNGANLWTDSILARRPLTGEIAWGFQAVHHDIWDSDIATPSALINTTVAGNKVTDIASAAKDGFAYDLQASSGAPQTGAAELGIEEKPVPTSVFQLSYPTQPIPKMKPVNRQVPVGTPCPTSTASASCNIPTEGPRKAKAEEDALKEYEEIQKSANTETTKPHVENGGYPCTTNVCSTGQDVFQVWGEGLTGTTELVPGQGYGRDRQQSSAYNPKLNLWFTCSQSNFATRTLKLANPDETEGTTFETPIQNIYGQISAYNMETGAEEWTKELPHTCFSGLLTAGELVYYTSATGEFIALNAKTGAVAFEFGKEQNQATSCLKGAAKKKGLNPAFPNLEEPVSKNTAGEEVWCHNESTSAAEIPQELINKENYNFGGNTGLGAGGSSPAIAFEFENKEYIAVYAGGGTEAKLTYGDYLWEFSLGGSGAATALKNGENAQLPETELCANFPNVRTENKNCEGQ